MEFILKHCKGITEHNRATKTYKARAQGVLCLEDNKSQQQYLTFFMIDLMRYLETLQNECQILVIIRDIELTKRIALNRLILVRADSYPGGIEEKLNNKDDDKIQQKVKNSTEAGFFVQKV